MDGQVVGIGDIIHPDGSVERGAITEVSVTAVTAKSILGTLKSIVQYIAGLAILIGFGLAVYWFGYFVIESIEWHQPPGVYLYDRYNDYRMYEDGSWSAHYRDGTQVKGCITGALCND